MDGDQTDIAGRLKRYLPRWFNYTDDPTPVLDSLLAGLAAILSTIYAMFAFLAKQVRVATSTGGWLDLTAYDMFGSDFPRLGDELDADYSLRIRREVLRERNTRNAIIQVVRDLTGITPHVYEGWYAPVVGGYGRPSFAFGRSGVWGSHVIAEVIVTMPRPAGYIIPGRGGWGSGTGGYGAIGGNFSFVGEASYEGRGARDVDVLRAIDRVRAAGVRVFVHFTEPV